MLRPNPRIQGLPSEPWNLPDDWAVGFLLFPFIFLGELYRSNRCAQNFQLDPDPLAAFATMLYTATLLRWLQRKRYQYEVTFSLYMLTPTEKFIFSTTPSFPSIRLTNLRC